jgi:hypothetical protein
MRYYAVLMGCLGALSAHATIAFQGFETNTGDWNASNTITRVASGGGTLGLTAASGGFYAELTNQHDGYAPGFGDGGFTLFDFSSSPPYPGMDFFQSVDIYIDPAWAAPVDGGSPAFWLDMSAAHPAGNYGAEHNFRFSADGSSVSVSADGQLSPIAALTVAGWYTFEMTYQKGANPTDLVTTEMYIFDASHTLLGSTSVVSDSPGGPLLSSDLGGPGYAWLTLWQNGFAGDTLGLDNVQADILTPEPATAGLLLAGLVLVMGKRFRRSNKLS